MRRSSHHEMRGVEEGSTSTSEGSRQHLMQVADDGLVVRLCVFVFAELNGGVIYPLYAFPRKFNF